MSLAQWRQSLSLSKNDEKGKIKKQAFANNTKVEQKRKVQIT